MPLSGQGQLNWVQTGTENSGTEQTEHESHKQLKKC